MNQSIDTDATDHADMRRLCAGHDTALNDLMERHATPVFYFLCRMLGNEDDANDLAQETFVRIFRARDTFHEKQKFTTWLYAIASNLARNHFRWRNRHPNVSLEAEDSETEQSLRDTLAADSPVPNTAAVANERTQAVRKAVDELPAELREAVILCEWEEQSTASVAEILGITPKAVESKLYRARKILREQLKNWL